MDWLLHSHSELLTCLLLIFYVFVYSSPFLIVIRQTFIQDFPTISLFGSRTRTQVLHRNAPSINGIVLLLLLLRRRLRLRRLLLIWMLLLLLFFAAHFNVPVIPVILIRFIDMVALGSSNPASWTSSHTFVIVSIWYAVWHHFRQYGIRQYGMSPKGVVPVVPVVSHDIVYLLINPHFQIILAALCPFSNFA